MKLGKIVLAFLLFVIVSIGLPETIMSITESDMYHVLFLGSYSADFITYEEELEGIREGFEDIHVSLDTEYLDTKRFLEEENIQYFYTYLKYKLEHTYTYDSIIVSDDAALQFVLDYQEELFPHIPIYFIGINDLDRAREAAKKELITGIVEKSDVVSNINLARRMLPEATRVVGIVDGSATGIGDEKQFLQARDQIKDLDFEVLRSSEYTFAQIGEILTSYDEQTILMFFTLNSDSEKTVLSMHEQFHFISKYANVPVFRISVGGVGDGLIGGKMIDYKTFGKKAATTLISVMNGASINDIELVEDTPYYYLFDQKIIDQYDLDASVLPIQATIINQKENTFEKYLKYFVVFVIVIIFLMVVIAIVIIDNYKTKKAQLALRSSNEQLLVLYEELDRSEKDLKQQYNVIQEHINEVNILNQKYENAISTSNSVVWEIQIEDMSMEVSSNIEHLLRKRIVRKDYYLTLFQSITSSDNAILIGNEIEDFIQQRKMEVNIQVSVKVQNDKIWIMFRGNGIYDLEGKLTEISGIIIDVTREKNKEEYAQYFAKHDFLTKLPNRMSFEETLAEELEQGKKGALLLFDLDDFKSINDTLGHAFGDEILKQIANRLSNICKKSLFVARMGGDEFTILLKDNSDEESIIGILEKIKRALMVPYYYEGIEEFVSFSMGITIYPNDGADLNQLLINADSAMYKVKRSGKKHFEFFRDEMKQELLEHKRIENILRQAVKNNEFVLYYQPQVDLNTGYIKGFEALLRLKNHQISPAVFIPIAEETGDIIHIGRWVMKEAIQQMVKWRDAGMKNKTVAINYSPKQLRDTGFYDFFIEQLDQHQINYADIEVEITESILLENSTASCEFLEKIHQKGIRIALDDFGSGYSSLNYLTFIPLNKIKLDKSISDKFLNEKSLEVIKSIISLVHSLDLEIVAEGIESIDQSNWLKMCECDYIQGYLYSKPIIGEAALTTHERKFEV